MKPLYLKIENFKSYKESNNEIDFERIHIACISGNNGNGKSSIAEAISWALFGEFESVYKSTRKGKAEEVEFINTDKDYMLVEFEFMLNNTTYKVIRRLNRKKKKDIQLYIKSNNNYIPLTEATPTKTQQRILNILKVNFDTFLQSVYLSQKRSSDFITADPSERKNILSQILGLDIYDLINKDAKAERDLLKSEIDKIDVELKIHDKIVSEKEVTLEKLSSLNNEKNNIESKILFLEEERENLNKSEAEYINKLSKVQLKAEQLKKLENDKILILKKIDETDKKINEISVLLQNQEFLYQKTIELNQLKQKHQIYLDKQNRYNNITNAIEAKKGELNALIQHLNINNERIKSIDNETQRLTNEINAIKNSYDNLRNDLKEVEKSLELIENEKKELEKLNNTLIDLQSEERKVEKRLSELRNEYSSINSNIFDRCPLCKRPITKEDKGHILNEIIEEGKNLKKEKETLQKNVGEIKEKIKNINVAIQKENQYNSRKLNIMTKLNSGEKIIENNKSIIDKNNAEKNNLISQNQLLNQKINTTQQEIIELNNQLNILDFNPKEYQDYIKKINELEKYQNEYNQLEKKKEQQIYYINTLENYKNDIDKIQKEINGLKKEIDELDQKNILNMIEKIKKENESIKQQINNNRDILNKIIMDLGEFEQKKKQIDISEKLIQENQQKLKELLMNKDILDTIIEITTDKGIKAEIIANTLPQIEDEANEILKKLTDGKFSVKFLTQRETSSGELEETLSIQIEDINGTRNYELFSGGELFRINFALRIALSKVLLKRSGASIRMLILDEGFGSQDEEGRQNIIECLNAIKEQFDCILVITHIEEFKDAFEQKIIVKKDMEGSKIIVV
ncbi:AAA family ATPase [Caldicellulosiruptoraceae bacterium PP1]